MNNYQSLQNYLGIQNIDEDDFQNNLEDENQQRAKKISNESSNLEDDSKLDDGEYICLIILDSRRRNKRRSKNDNDGRSHKCQTCGKAYLSYPALYTHIKTKHDMQGSGSGKGRGRPKKDIGVSV